MAMAGLQRGMMAMVGLVFVFLSYNLLTNRSLQTPSNPNEWIVLKSVSEGRVSLPFTIKQIVPCFEQRSQGYVPFLVQVAKQVETKLWGRPPLALEPCWSNFTRKSERNERGYVLITCSHGPHYHRYQIADAVIVAQQLAATLVMPTIKEALKEPASNFDDLYNVKHFINTLEGVVRIMGRLPEEARSIKQTIIQVPVRVTKTYIEEQIRPVFDKSKVILLDIVLHSTKGVEKEKDTDIEATRCLVIHRSLQFLPQIQKLGDRLVNRMREAAQGTGRHFVAIDYRADMVRQKTCDQGSDSRLLKKRCLSPHDLGMLLQSFGYPPETAIYLTQSRLDEFLDPLRSLFPNIITKEYSMPFNEENQFLFSGKTQFELAVDFYVCSRSDVFIPVIPRAFFLAVSGERISLGLTHILVPTFKRQSSSSEPALTLGVSENITRKEHPVFSCFCEGSRKANTRSKLLESSVASLEQSKQLQSIESNSL